MEYGDARDGYWTSDEFMKQMDNAIKIASIKYPKEDGFQVFWIFDQSGCHMAFAEDALNVNRMNAKEGGKQPCMHDTIFKGKKIYMTKSICKPTGEIVQIPRGMIDVLKQRSFYDPKKKVEDMRKELSMHSDFKNEKNRLEYFLHSQRYACFFLPKYH